MQLQIVYLFIFHTYLRSVMCFYCWSLQALLPLLKKAADAVGGTGLSCSRAAIVNITSRMGSIDDNTSGGSYPYRTSKV